MRVASELFSHPSRAESVPGRVLLDEAQPDAGFPILFLVISALGSLIHEQALCVIRMNHPWLLSRRVDPQLIARPQDVRLVETVHHLPGEVGVPENVIVLRQVLQHERVPVSRGDPFAEQVVALGAQALQVSLGDCCYVSRRHTERDEDFLAGDRREHKVAAPALRPLHRLDVDDAVELGPLAAFAAGHLPDQAFLDELVGQLDHGDPRLAAEFVAEHAQVDDVHGAAPIRRLTQRVEKVALLVDPQLQNLAVLRRQPEEARDGAEEYVVLLVLCTIEALPLGQDEGHQRPDGALALSVTILEEQLGDTPALARIEHSA